MHKEQQEIIEEWSKNINRLPEIGIDDWMAYYEETLQGKELHIQSDEDITKLMLDYDLSAKQAGQILACAWLLGQVDPGYHFPNPKQAIPMGNARALHLTMQKHIAKKEMEGKEYEYKAFIGPMAFEQEDDQLNDVTQNENVQFYTPALTDKGIEYTRSYLRGKIVTEIKNRLTVLKLAKEDYKAEAKQLVKTVNKIVKELS